MTRRRGAALTFATLLAAAALGPAAGGVRAGAATPVLPDLAMVPPYDFRIAVSSNGHRLLRFTTIVVNVGLGPFQLIGFDADGAKIGDILQVRQQIRYSDGTWHDRATTAQMAWAADGHDHWHVLGYQKFKLQKLDATTIGTGAKTGFCALDSYWYGSSKPSFYDADRLICQTGPSGTVLMGTQRKWGDIYRRQIAYQWVDITGLPNGEYKLKVIADPPFETGGRFRESNETNNRAWTRIRIGRTSVTVLSKSATP